VLGTLTAWLLGFLFGMRHALEPDHLAAVSTLVAEERSARRGAALGAVWGIGHSLALLVVGMILATLHTELPHRLAVVFELLVAAMLIGLGARAIWRAWRRHAHSHDHGHAHSHDHGHAHSQDHARAHSHDHGHAHSLDHAHARPHDRAHAHAHANRLAPPRRATASRRWMTTGRPLALGIVHGLAGSGALTALVLASLPSTASRLAYITLFGLGSVAGMAVLSGLAGFPLAHLGKNPRAERVLALVTGGFSAAFGFALIWPAIH
jgi:ABC-type nickel/cobalt efflux system permease component RcnA